MGYATDIFFPFYDEFNSIKSELGEVVEAIRKELELSLTHLPFVSLLDQFQLITLGTVLLPLVLSLLVEKPLFGSVEVLVDILSCEISELLF